MTVLYVILCTYITTKGSKQSNTFNQIFTISKLVTLLFICVVAFYNFKSSNFEPFFLPEQGGFMGTLYSSSIIFFAFLGFEFITCLSEESKNPIRDLPLSINLSIGFCCLLYCLIAVSLTGMAKLQLLNPSTAMADAFTLVGMDWMSFVIYVSAFIGITGSVFTKLMVRKYCSNFCLELTSHIAGIC